MFFVVCDVSQIGLGFYMPSVVLYGVYETNIYVFSDTGDFQDSTSEESV